MCGLRLPWRKSKAPAEGVDFDGLSKLLRSNALCIRAAMNPDTLDLYFRMMAAHSEAASREEGIRLAGGLFYKLTAAFAREAGKNAPDNLRDAVEFMKNEVKGFETAMERRDRDP